MPSRTRELSRFAAAIWDFFAGTPGGEVVEEVRAMGDMAKECGGGRVGGERAEEPRCEGWF